MNQHLDISSRGIQRPNLTVMHQSFGLCQVWDQVCRARRLDDSWTWYIYGLREVLTGNIHKLGFVTDDEVRRLAVTVAAMARAAVVLQSRLRGQLARRQLPQQLRQVKPRQVLTQGCCALWRPAEPGKAMAVLQPKQSKTPQDESCAKGEQQDESQDESCAKGRQQAVDANLRTKARRKRRRVARKKPDYRHYVPRAGSRAARRLADPAVKARREAFYASNWSAQGATAEVATGVMDGSVNNDGCQALNVLRPSKRTYTKEQMLELRSRSTSPLSAAAPIFVPHASRYSCHARAVSLGFVDSPTWQRPVPSSAAREMCVRVHSSLLQRA